MRASTSRTLDRRPRRHGPLLGRGRRPEPRHRLPRRRHDFDRAWVNQDMSRFQTGVQTVGVPAGGGAVFDVKIDEPGLYPFVSHSFASVDMGQVGLLKVGNPKGSAEH